MTGMCIGIIQVYICVMYASTEMKRVGGEDDYGWGCVYRNAQTQLGAVGETVCREAQSLREPLVRCRRCKSWQS